MIQYTRRHFPANKDYLAIKVVPWQVDTESLQLVWWNFMGNSTRNLISLTFQYSSHIDSWREHNCNITVCNVNF